MSVRNNTTTQSDRSLSLAKPVLIGAAIALVLISLFLFGVNDPDPAWGRYWMVKPLIMVPAAGAMGGLFYYFMDFLATNRGLNRAIAVILSLICYIVAVWMGSVLGLNGTLWD